jgi:hypothetical protein
MSFGAIFGKGFKGFQTANHNNLLVNFPEVLATLLAKKLASSLVHCARVINCGKLLIASCHGPKDFENSPELLPENNSSKICESCHPL